MFPRKHILETALMQSWSSKSVMIDVTVMSFLNQSKQNLVFLFVIPRNNSVQNLSKIAQETEKLQKWEMMSL